MRPDLRAAANGVTVARETVRLRRTKRWEHVTLGPKYAKEPGGGETWGVTLDVELPLFDTGRAATDRARAKMLQAEMELDAMEAIAAEEVLVAAEELAMALEAERVMREKVLPARQRAVDYATKYYNQMQLNMMHFLETRREMFETRREHTAARADVLRAMVDLEFAVGGTMPEHHGDR
jgi:cobalt-zinc-cadmium efflux system outer membrane protein